MHQSFAMPSVLELGVNENTKDVTIDDCPCGDDISILLDDEYLALLIPFKDLRVRIEFLEELNRARGINTGVTDIDGMVNQLPNVDHVRFPKLTNTCVVWPVHSGILIVKLSGAANDFFRKTANILRVHSSAWFAILVYLC
jgi:hypothetical protein